jgi:hypothetical protein
MKTFFIIMSLLLSLNLTLAAGLEGRDLSPAILETIKAGKVELEDEKILALEAKLVDDEVETRILTQNDKTLLFGCHVHGTKLDCHFEDFKDGANSYNQTQNLDLAYLLAGKKAALEMLEKTLKSKKLDLNSLRLLKAWLPQSKNQDSDHDHSEDVWLRIGYVNAKGKATWVFMQCHVHGGATKFACHYGSSAASEYNFSL